MKSPNYTDEEYKIKTIIDFCTMLLGDGIKVYNIIPELLQHWFDRGIAELKVYEHNCIPARKHKPAKKYEEKKVILKEERRNEVELVKKMMISLFYKN